MKFSEEKLEKAFTELLGQEGFSHHLGITISRKPEEVLIEEDLQNFLLSLTIIPRCSLLPEWRHKLRERCASVARAEPE